MNYTDLDSYQELALEDKLALRLYMEEAARLDKDTLLFALADGFILNRHFRTLIKQLMDQHKEEKILLIRLTNS